MLEAGGTLGLFWNFGAPPPPVAELLDPIYARLAPGVDGHSVLLGGEDRRADAAVGGIVASSAFEPPSVRTFAWSRTYDTRRWLELLQTHSDHQALPAERRARLLAAVGHAIDSLGGSFELPYRAILVSARRL